MGQESDGSLTLSVEELLAAARRRRWWIFLSAFVCWMGGWIVGWLWPPTYKSEAVVLVEQQKVPEQFVPPNVALDLQDRVESVTQQVLSRTRLQAVIDRWHLYSPGRGLRELLQSRDAVEQMREDITIELVASDRRDRPNAALMAFKIFYTADRPELAQRVNKELTDLFLDDNNKAQQLSESTTAFLNNQLAAARARLGQQEAAVRDFKAKHLRDLPSQFGTNMQILSGLQDQLQTAHLALEKARQQQLYLESLRRQYQSAEAEDLNTQLANLRMKYTDNYPDIIALKTRIVKRDALLRDLANQAGVEQGPDKPSEPMMKIESQIESNRLEVQNYAQREKDLEREVASYQARLNLTPEIEQQLAEISRGYEESKTEYDSLLKKQSQSELAANLEKGQQGDQFTILDPPSLPERPFSPNRLLVSLKGLALGIVLGLVISALIEVMDLRVRKERDLEGLVSARVLVGIPHLSYPGEGLALERSRRIEMVVATAMSALILLTTVYGIYKR
jgi:succinoglycan biosynthesis transport protein ExoP